MHSRPQRSPSPRTPRHARVSRLAPPADAPASRLWPGGRPTQRGVRSPVQSTPAWICGVTAHHDVSCGVGRGRGHRQCRRASPERCLTCRSLETTRRGTAASRASGPFDPRSEKFLHRCEVVLRRSLERFGARQCATDPAATGRRLHIRKVGGGLFSGRCAITRTGVKFAHVTPRNGANNSRGRLDRCGLPCVDPCRARRTERVRESSDPGGEHAAQPARRAVHLATYRRRPQPVLRRLHRSRRTDECGVPHDLVRRVVVPTRHVLPREDLGARARRLCPRRCDAVR
ncbi:exported hypothetical protein [Microbacterium sp. 8M]|nr:exported hypothetical protein [Microbacterium sp. 8M]